MYITIILVSYI